MTIEQIETLPDNWTYDTENSSPVRRRYVHTTSPINKRIYAVVREHTVETNRQEFHVLGYVDGDGVDQKFKSMEEANKRAKAFIESHPE